MAAHPGLQEEQAYIDEAYERLDEMRADAADLLASILKQRGGTHQAVAEREIVVRSTLARLSQLDIGGQSLCFGRIDREDNESFHIGRLAVSGRDQEPLVVDWRAPVAEPFYRATGRHPMGLTRRRHFATEGRNIVDIEDEVFGLLDVDLDGLELSGRAALLAALERSRTGQMRDIVATVQREQDQIIRAPLAGVLVVQGGPGTGKTAVALHRAAYLLYTHRFPLERQGVLVVGPNPLFLRYIEHVLPSLGETGVVLTTIEGLVHDTRASAEDIVAATRVKGDVRMARVLARAIRDRQRPLRGDVAVPIGGLLLRVTQQDSERVVAAARRRPGTHNSRRRIVENQLARLLHERYRSAVERRRSPGNGAEAEAHPDDDEVDVLDVDVERFAPAPGFAEGGVSEAELWREIRRLPDVAAALNRMWPLLTPQELLHDLFGAPPLIRLASRGILDDSEQACLARPRSPRWEDVQWTAADLALLDEARVLLGSRRRGHHGNGDDEVRSYGHIVVDEAQDLTPMQLRMLARRSLAGSMTVVGDVAQATGARAPDGWGEITEHLPSRRDPIMVELSVNYRTPAEIMAVAVPVLAAAAPSLVPPRSVRSTESPPAFVHVDAGDLALRAAALAVDELTRLGGAGGGSVAVIVTPSMTDAVAQALHQTGAPVGMPDREGLDAPISLVPVSMVKGLEFDAVVVVEPARIVAEAAQGLRALYVSLTRTTKRLAVVFAEPLPDVLSPTASSLPVRAPA